VVLNHQDIEDWITYKCAAAQALRQARKEELEAVWAKGKSAVDRELQAHLDRRAKL
jgi:hypothetical protein